jgi:hypothetical protein
MRFFGLTSFLIPYLKETKVRKEGRKDSREWKITSFVLFLPRIGYFEMLFCLPNGMH